jgi:predicted kinase
MTAIRTCRVVRGLADEWKMTATVPTMNDGPLLIVLRGNSASGKSTLARDLQCELGAGTANIGQDHFRRVVLREHDVADGDNIGLLANTIRYCSGLGHHVIVEGILVARHYREMLCQVIAEHQGPSHVFYLEVSLDEAMRRHQERPLAAEVSADSFRTWYVPSDLLGAPGETVLDATESTQRNVATIIRMVGDSRSAPRDARRYL